MRKLIDSGVYLKPHIFFTPQSIFENQRLFGQLLKLIITLECTKNVQNVNIWPYKGKPPYCGCVIHIQNLFRRQITQIPWDRKLTVVPKIQWEMVRICKRSVHAMVVAKVSEGNGPLSLGSTIPTYKSFRLRH